MQSRRLSPVSAALATALAFIGLLMLANVAKAQDWPDDYCLAPGYAAGDAIGPGDTLPPAPPCPSEVPDPRPSSGVSEPASRPLALPAPVAVGLPLPTQPASGTGADLPSTDTDQSPAITVIAIWVIAIIVILAAWYRLAWHDNDR